MLGISHMQRAVYRCSRQATNRDFPNNAPSTSVHAASAALTVFQYNERGTRCKSDAAAVSESVCVVAQALAS